MSIKSPSLKVFIKKNLPKALGGYKFYDQYLTQLSDVSPHKAWTIFHQEFIDEFVNKGSDRKWTAVPYLTPVDCPCSPGSVILVRERSFRRYIKRAPNHAFIAGIVTDFFPPEIKSMPVLVPVQENFERKVGSGAQYKKTYQSKNTEMAVIITMSGVRVSSVEEQLKTETTLLDLDNFGDYPEAWTKDAIIPLFKKGDNDSPECYRDSTGFKSTSCFLITRVLTADTLKVEVTVNGDVFYEHTYSVSVPVCFHANKVRVLDDGRGVVKDMRPVMKKLPLKILRRRVVQHFLNSFLPNQSKLGNAVGDAPAVLNWQEPTALRSYRPNFLPRPERCHQTDMIYYYKTDQELINIIYGQNGHRNTGRSSERPRRNRTRDKRTDLPSTRSSGCEVNNLPFDEIHTIQSEDASSVTSTGTSDDKSSDVTSEITTDTSESY